MTVSFLFFISFYTSVRLQNSIHSRNAKNWLLQKRYRQKGTHWHYILVMYYHVNKLQTHLPYGHYHKYDNYHWSALLNPARLSQGILMNCCDIQYVQFLMPFQHSIQQKMSTGSDHITKAFLISCHVWKIKKKHISLFNIYIFNFSVLKLLSGHFIALH